MGRKVWNTAWQSTGININQVCKLYNRFQCSFEESPLSLFNQNSLRKTKAMITVHTKLTITIILEFILQYEFLKLFRYYIFLYNTRDRLMPGKRVYFIYISFTVRHIHDLLILSAPTPPPSVFHFEEENKMFNFNMCLKSFIQELSNVSNPTRLL